MSLDSGNQGISEQNESRATIERRVLAELATLVQGLENARSRGMRYAIVGGVAVAASLGQEYEVFRPNGTVRDVDIMIIDDPHQEASKMKEIYQETFTESHVLPVHMNLIKSEDYASPLQFLSHLKKVGNEYALVFRSITQRIPQDLMETRTVLLETRLGTINIQTFDPGVLYHLYLQRVGMLKHKDVSKIRAMIRDFAKRDLMPLGEDHQKYRTFHTFAHAIRDTYPAYTSAMKLYNYLDHVLSDSLLTHSIIPRKLYQWLLDF